MIDIHAHLDFPEFDQDREEVISRFFEKEGKTIVNIGVDLERSQKSIELAEKYEGIYASVGLHPDWFTEHGKWNMKQVLEKLKKMAEHEKVVAIGECGLDYFRIKKPDFLKKNSFSAEEVKENQKRGFLAQIKIARELNLPVIVHCREACPVASDEIPERFEAWRDLYEIVSNFKFQISNFVLHCYSGSSEDTKRFLNFSNVHFSFSGNITYPKPKKKHDKLVEAIQEIPLDKIMLDSDSPFLAPQEMRGKRNEPINILYIAKKIAEIKKINKKEIERKTDENAEKFFRISLKNKN